MKPTRRVLPSVVLAAVAARYATTPEMLQARDRRPDVVRPRQVAMYLIREINQSSFPWIGMFFGGKDHTTVMYACRQVAARRQVNLELDMMIKLVIQELTDRRAA